MENNCGHKTIPPLASGVISIALMVEYRFYNEAVAFDGYKECFSCWLQSSKSDFSELQPDTLKLYLERAPQT